MKLYKEEGKYYILIDKRETVDSVKLQKFLGNNRMKFFGTIGSNFVFKVF